MLDYGIIGNCKTCALINKKASINWLCFPKFNSPSIFAKILDDEIGGSFEIKTKEKYTTSQEYEENTNILITNFKNKKNAFRIIDFFPRYKKLLPNRKTRVFRQNRMIRIIQRIRGKPIIKILYNPKLDYSRGENTTNIINDNMITKNNDQEISLISNLDYDIISNKQYFELNVTRYFVLGQEDNTQDFSVKHCLQLLSSTKRYWKDWVKSLIVPDKYRKEIIRSALVLKLLTFSETGAIVAAPTTSIPEEVGSQRTFDYRFCWIRDAAFTVDALKKIGRNWEAKNLMQFIFDNTMKKRMHMQIMYGIEGESQLTELELTHLKGFKNSVPVRIGNAAYSQKQNDIYGSVIDIMYLYYIYYEYEKKLPIKLFRFLCHLVAEIKKHWKESDQGIWEFRGESKHHTYSKLMCFVGVDRAIKIAQHFGKKADKWIILRDEIKHEIVKNSWNEKKGSFTMFYGGDVLDAAVLRMTYHEFLDKNDPKLVMTIRKIYEELRSGCFVQRYKVSDDFGSSKSTFTICSFWLIDALYYIGEKKKAERLFTKLIKHSNHLGLFSEDIDIKSGKLIGNFPQAYTHIALINSSILLSEWNAKRKKIDFSRIQKIR